MGTSSNKISDIKICRNKKRLDAAELSFFKKCNNYLILGQRAPLSRLNVENLHFLRLLGAAMRYQAIQFFLEVDYNYEEFYIVELLPVNLEMSSSNNSSYSSIIVRNSTETTLVLKFIDDFSHRYISLNPPPFYLYHPATENSISGNERRLKNIESKNLHKEFMVRNNIHISFI